MLRLATAFGLAALVLLTAFTARRGGGQEPVLPATPYNYAAITLPAHLQTVPSRIADNTPADNPITDAGATLGRVLF